MTRETVEQPCACDPPFGRCCLWHYDQLDAGARVEALQRAGVATRRQVLTWPPKGREWRP